MSAGCIDWLKEQAHEIDLEYNILDFPKPNEFAVWLTWKGTDPSLKTILLNSHIDVVPVEPVNNTWYTTYIYRILTASNKYVC